MRTVIDAIEIQIHLMFLFIVKRVRSNGFKCFIQIHLMFLFIVLNWVTGRSYNLIQIHLMFLFILVCPLIINLRDMDSNTSHVLIYLVSP